MIYLSEHFTLEELIRSDTASRLGINNMPSSVVIQHAKQFLIPGIEQIRRLLGKPMLISSGYRSPDLNKATPGSSNTSQHTLFEAIDFTSPEFGPVLDIAKKIQYSNIKFDQMIFEYGAWIHISFSKVCRGHILSKYSGTGYLTGLVKPDGKTPL